MCCALASTVLIVSVSGPVLADDDAELKIDKFQFAWTLVETGKTRFLIEKDQTSTKAWLRTAYDKVSMTPEDAEAGLAALAEKAEFFDKVCGTSANSRSRYGSRHR